MGKRNFDSMGKNDLRAACKAAGISYSKLTVEGMRDALKATQSPTRLKQALGAVVTTATAREMRNGVKRPRDGGLCAAVWQALDVLHAKGAEPTSKEIKEMADKKEWNVNNALCELSAWRRFNGIARSVPHAA